jgi:ADP-heptose:LPS heptosyltransferase
MGIGDEIMVTGEVARIVRSNPTIRRVMVCDPFKHTVRWDPIWLGNPHIAQPGQDFNYILKNAPGLRPYIKEKAPNRWMWKAYGPHKGEIYLDELEGAFAKDLEGAVLIQPWSKPGASPNKKWPMEYWQQLVDDNRHVDWVQVGHTTDSLLRGVRFVPTPTFRAACGALSGARAAVLQEGGLHHAAAALGKSAVVIFGGFIAPTVTGYNTQRNLFYSTPDHPLGCGMRVHCEHCATAMRSITPRDVMRELEELL